MNRAQFMEQLEKLLSDISEEERQEALDYYESYFDDAGEDQEANVIRELGSPGKVAAIIKADLRESSQNYGEYTENGFQDDRVKEDMQMPEQRGSRADALPITVKPEYATYFETHLKEFLELSRALARMRDLPAVIPVYDIFEANGTGYRISEYAESITFEEFLKRNGNVLTFEQKIGRAHV